MNSARNVDIAYPPTRIRLLRPDWHPLFHRRRALRWEMPIKEPAVQVSTTIPDNVSVKQ